MNTIYKNNNRNQFGNALLVLLMICIVSCRKFITVEPPITSNNGGIVYENDPTAIAAVTSLYATMSNENLLGQGFAALNALPGLSADELTLFSGSTNLGRIAYYKNQLTSQLINGLDFWRGIYPYVYIENEAIEGISASKGMTSSIKNQLLGESYFMRAYSYFNLVNLYGDVPLILTTDYNKAAGSIRTPKDQVYQQIIKDLLAAQSLMQDIYFDATLTKTTNERVRPNKSAAIALLARIYLYTNNWVGAEGEATKLINNTSLYETVPLDDVFLMNSKETIWALQNVGAGNRSNSPQGRTFILPSTGPTEGFPYYLNPDLTASFDIDDNRLSKWTKTLIWGTKPICYATKYKIGQGNFPSTEYSIVLRIAEQYLIRAEARAQQNNLTGMNSAKSDLDIIRSRAGLEGTTAMTKEALLKAILVERRHELFTEWGHRWFDLKRTGKIDEVMPSVTNVKGGTWNSNWALYPIYYQELETGINLKQNPGYE
ncbi:RagB/SusD family nutrient uptake outer membrane protein [Chitinophaga oryziterrae]|uniref:RagB/SusD family nutrient uptake outer membrane protein n=1 Tax=Chitinophaga oryziterrae TaxID=1031224 RepID=A0A6N8J573_9BACT|nr:RagB/SusD family nutrient uptake outer membrane protein [Chitinophaga oryziterrae]MVT40193.1 RagB/SusD family nutrient uptake outer membrane protein [Chitinophaga oryziterrae]